MFSFISHSIVNHYVVSEIYKALSYLNSIWLVLGVILPLWRSPTSYAPPMNLTTLCFWTTALNHYQYWQAERVTTLVTRCKWQGARFTASVSLIKYTLGIQSFCVYRQGILDEEEEGRRWRRRRMRGRRAAGEKSYGEVLSFITRRGTHCCLEYGQRLKTLWSACKNTRGTEDPSILLSLTLPEENDRLQMTQ